MEDISTERSPRGRPRKISENVRELHALLTKVLNNEDRTFIIQSLNQYQREKNVNNLVASLKSVLDTPRKREVYPLLQQIIPHHTSLLRVPFLCRKNSHKLLRMLQKSRSNGSSQY